MKANFIRARINRAVAYHKIGYIEAAQVDYNTIKLERPDLARVIKSISSGS
jgi:hypothetical protein